MPTWNRGHNDEMGRLVSKKSLLKSPRKKKRKPSLVYLTRAAMFKSQDGRCYYCKQKMRLMSMTKPPQDDIATIEHLDPKTKSKRRRVIACHKCNREAGEPGSEQHKQFTIKHRGTLS